MANCEYCGSDLTNSQQFCDGCGAPIQMAAQEEPKTAQTTYIGETADTAAETFGSWGQATAAGLGASLLGNILRGAMRSSMRRPSPPPMGGMFHGHGTPGHRGGFGGPRGGFGGPGGHRGGFGGRRGGPR